MNDIKRNIGKFGEDASVKYLESKGYLTIARNYHSRYGEVDIIAENEFYIVFVEVKCRKSDTLISGIDAVDKRKQGKIIKTAYVYLQNNKIEKQIRFDVIELRIGYKVYIKHIENAFDGGHEYAFF